MMSNSNLLNQRIAISILTLMLLLPVSNALGQRAQPPDAHDLPPRKLIERELTGTDPHLYRFTLQAGEFFQVRVEQKSIDVRLKLTDAGGHVLATMDSPNEKEGSETLSWVATQAGGYTLEVIDFNEKAGRGIYTIRRETPRTATPQDKRRVEVERVFVEGMTARNQKDQAERAIAKLEEAQRGWEELKDAYLSQLTAKQIQNLKEAPTGPVVGMLPVGKTIEYDIKGSSDQQFYIVELKQGQLLQINVQEKGVDMRLVLVRLEDTTPLRSVNFDYGYGDERLTAVIEQTGRYAVLLVPSESSLSGSYSLLAEVKETATASDKEQIEAERLLAEGIDNWNESSGEGMRRAILKWEESLPLWKKLGMKKWEGFTRVHLGKVYKDLGQYRQAFGELNQALTLSKAAGDKRGEAGALNNLGKLYSDFGDPQKALVFDLQALELCRAVGDKLGEALMLVNIGMNNYDLKEYQKAIDYYNKSLPLVRLLRNADLEAVLLNDMGGAYEALQNKEKALYYYNQSLVLRRSEGDKQGEANTLHNISHIHMDSEEYQKALDYNDKALLLRKIVGIEMDDANTLDARMFITGLMGNQRLAIFYGKQAVNVFQKLRHEAYGLDNRTQKSLLDKVKHAYKILSQLLLAEGRLEEAVQVLNLYRDQQFFDFNRDAALPARQVVLSPREQEFVNRYQIAGARLGRIGAQLEALRQQVGNGDPSEQQTAQRKKYEAELQAASESFLALLKESVEEFAKPQDDKDKVSAIADVDDMRAALRELSAASKQKTAAVYTLFGSGAFQLFLMTPDGEVKNFSTPVKSEDLERQILKFYAILQSPHYDPRPTGKELYDIIFKPVAAELEKQGIQTLMWQLDGHLRYIPVGALFDGERYLADRFRNVLFTRAERARMTHEVSRVWTGSGFGGSRAQEIDLLGDGSPLSFTALPGVTSELEAIFRADGKVLDGDLFVDANFTRKTFFQALTRRRPLVHIASHFAFRPGDDSRSFLVLGDGTALTLSEMKQHENLFEGVELLTLSACDTAATQADASGKEIDGFAELAQRLGADAVIASLWAVADESTALLMTEFYRLRKESLLLTKAAALQLAQQKMLAGKLQLPPGERRRSAKAVKAQANLAGTPAFPFDKSKPYAHPYYWSPFVLIGNWR